MNMCCVHVLCMDIVYSQTTQLRPTPCMARLTASLTEWLTLHGRATHQHTRATTLTPTRCMSGRDWAVSDCTATQRMRDPSAVRSELYSNVPRRATRDWRCTTVDTVATVTKTPGNTTQSMDFPKPTQIGI